MSDGDDGGNEGGNAKLERTVEEAENKIKLMEQEVKEWRKKKRRKEEKKSFVDALKVGMLHKGGERKRVTNY